MAGIFEIHNRVLVAVEQFIGKGLPRLVYHSGETEFRARIEGRLNETAEKCGGSCAVEAMIMMQDANKHLVMTENLSACLN
jgi:hypothetical protein